MSPRIFVVNLKCSPRSDPDDLDRKLTISPHSLVPIGRASKTEHKQLAPAVENGYIRNPVISRNHAEIYVSDSSGIMVVKIRDTKSAHGTWLNGKNIAGHKHALKTGDRLQFGSSVVRGEDTFQPAIFDVHVARILPRTLPEPNVAPSTSFGRKISYPEEFDDDSELENVILKEFVAKGTANISVKTAEALNVKVEPLLTSSSQLAQPTLEQDTNADLSNDIIISLVSDVEESEHSNSDDESGSDISMHLERAFSECLCSKPDDVEDAAQEDAEHEEADFKDELDEVTDGQTVQAQGHTPSSPTSVPSDGWGPSQLFGARSKVEWSYSPPPPTGVPSSCPYMDGPFMYSMSMMPTSGELGLDQMPQHSNVCAPWPNALENDAKGVEAVPLSRSLGSVACTSAQPEALEAATAAEATSRTMTSSTEDLLKQMHKLPRISSKNNMAIDNLIHKAVETVETVKSEGKKRKAEEMEQDSDVLQIVSSDHLETKAASTETSVEPKTPVASISNNLELPKISRPILQPKTKKRRLASSLRSVALGAVIGAVGTFATLMSLPDSHFA